MTTDKVLNRFGHDPDELYDHIREAAQDAADEVVADRWAMQQTKRLKAIDPEKAAMEICRKLDLKAVARAVLVCVVVALLAACATAPRSSIPPWSYYYQCGDNTVKVCKVPATRIKRDRFDNAQLQCRCEYEH